MTFQLIIAIFIIVMLAYNSYNINSINKKTPFKNKLFEISENVDHIFVPVSIDGNQYYFLVDSGCDFIYLDCSILESIQNKKKSGNNVMMSGAIGDNETIGDGYFINITINNNVYSTECYTQDFSYQRDSFKEKYGIDFYGIIGSEFMSKYDWSIQYTSKKVCIYGE